MQKQKMSTRYMAVVAMFTAVAFVAVLLAKVIPNVAGFLSYEPKDAVIVIASFIFGPMTGVIISLLVSFIEMISISTTGIYGFLMNVVSTCAFVVPAAWLYKKDHSQKGAVLGLGLGVVLMAIVMVVWNYIITPFYMGVPREVVAGMLASVFLPFNLIKGGINAALTLLLYKPIVGALRKAGLVEPTHSSHKGKFSLGFTLFSVASASCEDGIEPESAKNKIESLRDVQDRDPACERIAGQQLPDEQQTEQGLGDVDAHAPELFTQALETAVHRHIRIHHRNQRSQEAEKFTCLAALIEIEGQRPGA